MSEHVTAKPHPTRLLTDQDVVDILRLDVGRRNPREALRTLRRRRQLAWVRVGRRILYRPADVDRFIESQVQGARRNDA